MSIRFGEKKVTNDLWRSCQHRGGSETRPGWFERNCEKLCENMAVNITNLRCLRMRSREMAGMKAGGSCGIEEEFMFCFGWLTLNSFKCWLGVSTRKEKFEDRKETIRSIPRKAQWDCPLLFKSLSCLVRIWVINSWITQLKYTLLLQTLAESYSGEKCEENDSKSESRKQLLA